MSAGGRLIRPRRLRAGDKVAAVTLSWGGPGRYPERYQAGKRQLCDTFGVDVVEMKSTLADPEFVDRHPEARADDLMSAFADSSIAGIVSTIGGNDSIRILPFVDLEVIRANPKVFIGYSDTTITHMACLRAGLTSFYGPSIMAGFGENGGIPAYLAEGVRRVVFEGDPPGEWPDNKDGWMTDPLPWDDPENQERPRRRLPSTGWRWHQGREIAEGPLVVGCLDVLDWLRGTAWWPNLDGAILAIETSEDAPSPSYVAGVVRSLAAMGDLQRIAGLLVGRPGGSELEIGQHADYDAAILGVVKNEQHLVQLPVVTGMDFGHTDPMWTLPEGAVARIDPVERKITLTTSAVS